jgi:hypothetical protein
VTYRVRSGVVAAVPVTEGLSDESRVEILTGLNTGEQIVADARKPMAPGTKVRAIPVASSAGAADQ